MQAPYEFLAEESFGLLLDTISKSFSRLLEEKFEGAGKKISVEQWLIIAHLSKMDGQIQQWFTTVTGRDKATITRMLDDLEKRRLIRRVVDTEDRRQKQIYLTDAGKHFHAALEPVVINYSQHLLEGIDPADLQTCKKVLKKITHNLAT